MAYVGDPKFLHDVFISYGHDDDAPPTKGWVRSLHEFVAGKLKTDLSRASVVWRDPRLDGQDYLEETVREAVKRSAMFVSILTPGFIESEWCAKEASWFLEEAGSQNVPGKSRVVRVVKSPLNETPWPKGLEDGTLHYPFYDRDPQSGKVTWYAGREGDETYQRFLNTCGFMVQGIIDVLKKMRKAAQAEKPPEEVTATVFVAYASTDVREIRDAIIRELTDRRCRVVQPALTAEMDGAAVEGAVLAALADADVAVHVMGRAYGAIPEGSEESIVAMQVRLGARVAKERKDRALARVAFQPEGLDNVEPKQHALLESLSRRDATGEPADYITGTVTSFKNALLDLLVRRPRHHDAGGVSSKVCLLYTRRDVSDRELHAMRDWLANEGFPVDDPVFQAEASTLTRMEQESIIESGATLIYYGSAEDAWVRQKRRDIQKAWAMAPAPTRARAVFLAVPEDDLKHVQYRRLPQGRIRENDTFAPLLVLGDCGPFDPAKLNPLTDWMDSVRQRSRS
jgi:hypothetical protein